jgi:hypothetical protein
MSTGLECIFVEEKPGRWFYVLEDGSAPKDAWDWMDYATAYGPFKTMEAAHDHLDRHHANPGGYSVYKHDEKETATLVAGDTWKTLMENTRR